MLETKKFYHNIDLVKNQLLNFLLHPVTTAEKTTLAGTLNAGDEGLCVYDTDLAAIYIWDGSAFISGSMVETDPVYTASSWFTTTNNSGQWDTAYSWGDHSLAGYLTSYTETDPIYTASTWYSTTNNSTNWNTAYGWGNHATAGYLTSYTETDPVFTAWLSGFSLSGYVPTSRTLTINGTGYDLSANRSWTIDSLPTQTGNNGKYLKTNGTTASWEVLSGNVSLFTNDAGYLVAADLSPYLTTSLAALTYYPLSNPSAFISLSSLSAGTGISYSNITGVITNSAPDQTVVLTSGTGISVTGTYPNFTITATGSLSGYVPYIGATSDLNLGEYQLLTGQVTFDQSPTGTAGVGIMRWNNTDGTVDLGLKGGNVTLQIGQEQVVRVVNKTTPLINLLEANYQVVLVTGATGQRLSVRLAQANNDANSAGTLGVVTETINGNQEGFVTISGEVKEIDTTGSLQGETWNDGDILYLSPTTAGAITNIKPTAPQHSVIVGYVEYAHAIHGKIFVKVDNGYEIGELHDVYVPSPSNGDGIFWNTANSRYQNNTIVGVLGYTPANDTGVVHIAGTETITGDKTFGNIYSNGVVSDPHQLATKEYVDLNTSSGIHVHTPVRVETQAPLTATYANGGTTPTWTDITSSSTLATASAHGLITDNVIVFNVSGNGITAGVPYFVYDAPTPTTIRLSSSHAGAVITTLTNGTGLSITSRANPGVGATLTNSGAQAALVIDTISVSVGNRVLVYQQTNAWENGVYEVTNVGSPSTNWVLTRAAGEDIYDYKSITGLGEGDYFFVQEGYNSAGESYVMTTTGVIIFGTTNITFTQFSAAIDYTGGTNITVNGQTISVSGQIAITNGGTGASDAPTARTNLGLAIGTDIPSPTGTGASGTWGISISGNAATVTNGVYTTGSYSDPSWINTLAYSKLTGAPTNVSTFTNDAGYLTSASLSGYVQSTRTLTINGTAFDLSANRSWTVGDVLTSGSYANPAWITSLAYSKLTGAPTNVSSFTNDSGYITSAALSGYLLSSTAASTYQPLDADLTAIAALTGTSGFLKTNGAGTWSVDTNTYLTANQSITLSGDVSGSGSTSISTTIGSAAVTYAKIQNVAANTFLANVTGSAATVQEISTGRIPLFSSAITGTPSSSTYLRGDGTWATVSGGSLSGTAGYIVKFGVGGTSGVDSSFYESTGVMIVNTNNTVDKGYIIYDIALEAPRFEFISNGGNNFIKSNGSSYMDVVLNSGTYTHRFFSDGNIGIKTTTNAGYVFDINGTFRTSGVNTLSNLAGSGTRMVVADATGILSTQAIPGGSSFTWNEVTGTSQTAAVNNGYITNNAALVTVTLPSTAAVGDVIKIAGKGAGGWKLAQNAGQTIYFGTDVTTTGTSGYLAYLKAHDCVELVCITANTDWQVVSSIGHIFYF